MYVTCIFTLVLVYMTSSTTHASANYDAGSRSSLYSSIPSDYELQSVIVVTRHGDRAQISKELGPNYPPDSNIEKIWESKLPSQSRREAMYSVANTNSPLPSDSSFILSESLKKKMEDHLSHELYTGWDAINAPYAQLTDRGSQQLIAVGKELRRRYVGTLLPKTLGEGVDMLYCRSTNICRTMQSLRSLLVGLYDIESHTECEHDNEAIINIKKQGLLHHLVPTIETRPRTKETLFPQADGPSPAVTKRRLEIFPDDYLVKNYPGYVELEDKVRRIFGFTEKTINWLTIKEVLTCYSIHDIELPQGISSTDIDKITDLTGWMWGRIYGDDDLNRLAIGRFIREMISDLESSLSESPLSCHVKMLIYSGHDSTLVPLLCALGIYDGIWPLYASYITIETAVCKNSDKKMVRVTYNDKDQIIKGADSIWCDYDVFMSRMKKMSISRIEYNIVSAGEAIPDDIKM